MAIQLRGDSKKDTNKTKTKLSSISLTSALPPSNIMNGNNDDHHNSSSTTTTPPPSSQQQCQIQRRHNNNNNHNYNNYITTPKPESSPELSKLWISGGGGTNFATPRRVLSYKSATTTISTATSSSSPLTSSSPNNNNSQKRRQRHRYYGRHVVVLLTSIVGISTWMYISIAYFALSQWYYLNERGSGGGHVVGKTTTNNIELFSFQPSSETTFSKNEGNNRITRRQTTMIRRKNNNNNGVIIEEVVDKGRRGTTGGGESKSNDNDNDSSSNHHYHYPRIVHYDVLDHYSSSNSKNDAGRHHDNINFLQLPPLLVGITTSSKRDNRLTSIQLPSSSSSSSNNNNNNNRSSTISSGHNNNITTTTFVVELDEEEEGGMGFHEIIRGNNNNTSNIFSEEEDGDNDEDEEEKSFVITLLSDSNNATTNTANNNDTAVVVVNNNNNINNEGNDDDDNNNNNNPPPSSCTAMQDWQTKLLVTCNNFHELDWSKPKFLAQGWFRDTWKYDDDDDQNIMVLKTLRYEREYLDEYYELHRRDAIAMEHLTFSAFVLNIYGHCGQSALNEYAAGVGDVNSLEVLDRRLRGKQNKSWKLKLRMAVSIAVGLVHIQYGPPSSLVSDRRNNVTLVEYLKDTTTPASMAHYDINPRNIAIVPGGRPKLNDFNVAEFLTIPNYNNNDNNNIVQTTSTTTSSNNNNNKKEEEHHPTCGKFRSRLHDPWWRAPEEMDTNSTTFVDEAVDVYALGNVLFHILTTHSPRGKMKKDRAVEVREKLRRGIKPDLPSPYNDIHNKNVDGTVLSAFHKALDLCFEPDPTKRGTSKQVALVLHDAYQEVLAASTKKI